MSARDQRSRLPLHNAHHIHSTVLGRLPLTELPPTGTITIDVGDRPDT